MRNKLKIAAVVVAIIAGMVLYKSHFEKKESEKKDKDDEAKDKKRSARAEKHRWN
jgi:hypothetical protein